MKSILQPKEKKCYLCQIFDLDYSDKAVEVHHVFYGTANRKLSERYGLKVYLCPEHHRTGKFAVQTNHDMDMFLKDRAQRFFDEFWNGSKDFLLIFGKNYRLDEKELKDCLAKIKGERV